MKSFSFLLPFCIYLVSSFIFRTRNQFFRTLCLSVYWRLSHIGICLWFHYSYLLHFVSSCNVYGSLRKIKRIPIYLLSIIWNECVWERIWYLSSHIYSISCIIMNRRCKHKRVRIRTKQIRQHGKLFENLSTYAERKANAKHMPQ